MGSSSVSTAKITVPKMLFIAGEKISVKFAIDNSQSDIKVSYYELKLRRKLKTNHIGCNRTVTIADAKVNANCGPKENEEVTVDLQIPSKEIDYATWVQAVSNDDVVIKDTFTPSTVGKNFSVRYVLTITVKHDVFSESDENKKAFRKEVFIHPPLFGQQVIKQEEESDVKKPNQWDPQVEGVVVAETGEEAYNAGMNEYYRDIIVPAHEANIANLNK